MVGTRWFRFPTFKLLFLDTPIDYRNANLGSEPLSNLHIDTIVVYSSFDNC